MKSYLLAVPSQRVPGRAIAKYFFYSYLNQSKAVPNPTHYYSSIVRSITT